MIGKMFLYTGLALIAATALRATVDLIQSNPTDPWVYVFAAGCIAVSIGLGLTGLQPWKGIKDMTDKLGR